MSLIKKCLFSALLAPLLGGPGSYAAEFEVMDRFSVDGYTVLRGSADIQGGSFSVGGSTFVVKAGNVGIGTTGPGALLEVKQNADTIYGGIKVLSLDGSSRAIWIGARNDATARIESGVSGTGNLILNSGGGNVGIGATAPSARLYVLGTSGTANATGDTLAIDGVIIGPNYAFNTGANPVNLSVQSNAALAADAGGTIGLGGRYTGAQYANWAILKGAKENATDGNFASYLAFGTRANGVQITEKMRINSSGNVGIGTTDNISFNGTGNAKPLVVSGAGASTVVADNDVGIVIRNSDTTANNTSGLHFAAASGASSGANLNPIDASIVAVHGARTANQYQTGQLAFLTSTITNGAPSEKMRLDNNRK